MHTLSTTVSESFESVSNSFKLNALAGTPNLCLPFLWLCGFSLQLSVLNHRLDFIAVKYNINLIRNFEHPTNSASVRNFPYHSEDFWIIPTTFLKIISFVSVNWLEGNVNSFISGWKREMSKTFPNVWLRSWIRPTPCVQNVLKHMTKTGKQHFLLYMTQTLPIEIYLAILKQMRVGIPCT